MPSAAIQQYAKETPTLTLPSFFSGPTTAHGLVKDWRGNVTRRFYATIDGTFDAKSRGTLKETFTWADGEVQHRTWQVWPTGPNTFAGTAGDVVGEAKGEASGNVLHWRYTLAVARPGGKTINIKMDDWMYLLNDGTLLNITGMYKFGLKVGEVVIFIQPVKK
jgi:hypothetical protein